MGEPVDLLLISWNRREYLEKTLENLLSDPADFRLHCWDNGSQDGASEVIASLSDPRIAERHFSNTNVGQCDPCMWFFEKARGDLCGKIDDDVLLPHGWTERLAPLVRASPRFGMLGCWIFMPEDWDESLARANVREIDGVRLFVATGLAGHSFLARRETLLRYRRAGARGLPIDRTQMTLDGLVSGYPLPLMFAHNMDDPRSSHCRMGEGGHPPDQFALTFRTRGFRDLKQYADWIAADAHHQQATPIARQIWTLRVMHDQSLLGRVRRKALHTLGLL